MMNYMSVLNTFCQVVKTSKVMCPPCCFNEGFVVGEEGGNVEDSNEGRKSKFETISANYSFLPIRGCLGL